MQSYHRVHVQLGKKDRKLIAGMLNKGREFARVLRRASILRQLDQGQTAAQVASNVGVAFQNGAGDCPALRGGGTGAGVV
jgi:hypothetical protein